MSISGVGGSMGSYNYTYGIQSSPQKTDFRKIFEEEKAEFYEKYKNGETKPSYQIGGSSFTEEDWDKLIEGVDELTQEMREIMREQHKKRYERLLEKRREEYYERYPNLVTSKEFGGIYATFEICGMMERTAAGIVKIGSVKAFDHLK